MAITWRIAEQEEGLFTLDRDDALVLQRDNAAELIMYIYAASTDNQDSIFWADPLGGYSQTVAESKQSIVRLENRIQELTGGHTDPSQDLDIDLIEQRLTMITPGNWSVSANNHDVVTDDEATISEWGEGIAMVEADMDAIFVAHAPADVFALLLEVRRLRTLLYSGTPDNDQY